MVRYASVARFIQGSDRGRPPLYQHFPFRQSSALSPASPGSRSIETCCFPSGQNNRQQLVLFLILIEKNSDMVSRSPPLLLPLPGCTPASLSFRSSCWLTSSQSLPTHVVLAHCRPSLPDLPLPGLLHSAHTTAHPQPWRGGPTHPGEGACRQWCPDPPLPEFGYLPRVLSREGACRFGDTLKRHMGRILTVAGTQKTQGGQCSCGQGSSLQRLSHSHSQRHLGPQ